MKIWKGESYETVFIKIKWSNPVDHDYMLPCGYDPPFHEGWRYLLFAAGGQTSLGICSWSDDLDSYQSQEIVAELGAGKKPIPGSVGPMPERVGEPVPTPTVPAPAKVVQLTSEPTAPAPAKVGELVPTPTVPAPARVVQPTSEPTVPALAQNAQPSSRCNSPLGYVPNGGDLSAFSLMAPLAWLAWRRRSRN